MTYVVVIAIAILLMVAAYLQSQRNAQRPRGARRVRTDQRRCESCSHWSWKAGQQALASHPPFREVMQVLQPHQAGPASREFVPNEEYLAVREALGKALEAGDDEKIKELQSRLDVLNPKRLASEEAQGVYQGLSWSDFGACKKRQLVIARVDTCEAWIPADDDHLEENYQAERQARMGGGVR